MHPDDRVTPNGIDAATGFPLAGPTRASEVAARARSALGSLRDERARRLEGLPFELDPADLAGVGWGLIAAEAAPADALGPLMAWRRAKAGDLVKRLDYRPGETAAAWLARHGAYPGTITPGRVPFYLLIAGGPAEVPFEFAAALGVDYAVGRVAFDDPADYDRYARGVVAHESGVAAPAAREVAFWATRHPGDRATRMSADDLIAPLIDGSPADGLPPIARAPGFAARAFVGDAATRANLAAVLHRSEAERPSVLVAAAHGLGFRKGDPRQVAEQGALVAQDWPGLGPIDREHAFAAPDVTDEARVHGLFALLFACFGAGTPARDAFPADRAAAAAIADRPFVAALPRRLLGHPRGGALAVLGHVERAWGYSIRPPGLPRQIGPLRNLLGRILRGDPIGLAARDLGARSAEVASHLIDLIEAHAPDAEIARAWAERNDARYYALLGDPAARIRRNL